MKTTIPQTTVRVLILLACVSLSACNTKKKSSKDKSDEPPPFDRAEFTDITPMLDGSAYATSVDSRIWYLHGNQAVRVTLVGDASQKLPESFEITPVLDGSAYLVATLGDGGLWHLRGEHAERVSEVAAFADTTKPAKISDRAFYALYLTEHKKRKKAEDRADNPPEPPDDRDPY